MGALEMLRSTADFQADQQEQTQVTSPSDCCWCATAGTSLDRTRYGISTGKRIGAAVVRNGCAAACGPSCAATRAATSRRAGTS